MDSNRNSADVTEAVENEGITPDLMTGSYMEITDEHDETQDYSTECHLFPSQKVRSMPHRQQLQLVASLESETQYLAISVDNVVENLCNLLHSISSICADNVECHKNAVNKLTDSMDANIKSMYTIMAKTEEITNQMKSMEPLAARIREIKRLIDLLFTHHRTVIKMQEKSPPGLNLTSNEITVKDILRLLEVCRDNIREDELYGIRNDAKLRAIYTSQSYDEFKDIVDAAHLKSIDKIDKSNAKTKSRIWNSAVKEADEPID